MDDALCAQADPDAWFPEHGGGPATAARRICGRCPVRAECLDYALARREQYGIWGGLNIDERRRVARERERGGTRADHAAVA